jgi:hypothetical protein
MRKVTFKTLDNFRKSIGFEYQYKGYGGKLRRIVAEEVMSHDQVTLQAFRQFFKSTLCSWIGGAYVINGGIPIVAAPTMRQSTKIIYWNIKNHANKCLSEYVGTIKREPDTTTDTIWWEGKVDDSDIIGRLLALSANDKSNFPPEGFTGDFVIVDEGHLVPASMVGVFTPMIYHSRLDGTGKVVVSGVGGHKTSAIEALKKKGYHSVKMSASKAVEIEPAMKDAFEVYRKELSDWEWDKYFECKEITAGLRIMYEDIPGYVMPSTITLASNFRPEYYIGIDVGRVSDQTVVKVVEVWPPEIEGPLRNEIATFRLGAMNFIDQAGLIYDWIDNLKVAAPWKDNELIPIPWDPKHIVVELNGMGVGLFDALNKTQFESVNGIYVDADLKKDVWLDTNKNARNGRFGVMDEKDREHYLSMMYNTRESDGKLEFEHSDDWSALIMAWAAQQKITAL